MPRSKDDPKAGEDATSESASPPKRARLKPASNNTNTVIDIRQCHIARMPLELLAEILSYAPSPRDVLSLTRCNKFFCATLVRKSSEFIWRQARANCNAGRIPDPTPNWSEAGYAAFLFDVGECEMCKKVAQAFHVSYALRTRLCGDGRCLANWNLRLSQPPPSIAGDAVTGWLPCVETARVLRGRALPVIPTQYYPEAPQWYCQTDLSSAIDAFEKAKESGILTEYLVEHEPEARRMPVIMKHAVLLSKWKEDYNWKLAKIKQINEKRTRDISENEGWDVWDLRNTATYSLFLRTRNKSLQEVTLLEFDVIRERVEVEVTEAFERKKRRKAEANYRQKRERIATYYDHLRGLNSKTGQVIPNIKEFHRLPVIKVLESKASSSNVDTEIRSSTFVSDMLQNDLAKWEEEAKARLGGVLGYPDWKCGSTKRLHPVKRLTARFICKKCEKTSKKYAEYGSLDFKGACAHRCLGLDKKQRAKAAWSADQFMPDEKAIKAITEVLTLCGANPEKAESFSIVEGLGATILCNSCDAAIVMDSRSLCAHSRRHDDMQIELLPKVDAEAILRHPFGCGLRVKELMESSYHSKKVQARKEFGCRHCTQSNKGDFKLVAKVERTSRWSLEGYAAPSPGRLWDFNGLRSHVKAKHGVQVLGDEDFYSLPSSRPDAFDLSSVIWQ